MDKEPVQAHGHYWYESFEFPVTNQLLGGSTVRLVCSTIQARAAAAFGLCLLLLCVDGGGP